MIKKGLGLTDIPISGLPYENRDGLKQDDLEKYDRFFGNGKDIDESNENVLPVAKKTKQHNEDPAYNQDLKAKKYFDYLFARIKSKKKRP